jgi:hypothetical protein
MRIPLSRKTRYHFMSGSKRGADGGKIRSGVTVVGSYFEV